MGFFYCVFCALLFATQAQVQAQEPLSAILLIQTSQNNESTSFCDVTPGTWIMPYQQYKQGLLDACSRDSQCANFFYQQPGKQNMRKFEFLLGSTMTYLHGDILRPLRETFCLHSTSSRKAQVQGQTQVQTQVPAQLEAVAYAFAIQTILARRHSDQPVCGLHHIPNTNEKTGATDCVLASDQSTQSCASNYTFLLIVFSVGLAVMVFLNFTLCYININNLIPRG